MAGQSPDNNRAALLPLVYVLALTQFALPFMYSGVGVTLPSLGLELGTSGVGLGLIETVYLAAGAAFPGHDSALDPNGTRADNAAGQRLRARYVVRIPERSGVVLYGACGAGMHRHIAGRRERLDAETAEWARGRGCIVSG